MGMFDEVVMVQDRVTGEMYDANQKFLEMMSSPEVMQVLVRLKNDEPRPQPWLIKMKEDRQG